MLQLLKQQPNNWHTIVATGCTQSRLKGLQGTDYLHCSNTESSASTLRELSCAFLQAGLSPFLPLPLLAILTAVSHASSELQALIKDCDISAGCCAPWRGSSAMLAPSCYNLLRTGCTDVTLPSRMRPHGYVPDIRSPVCSALKLICDLYSCPRRGDQWSSSFQGPFDTVQLLCSCEHAAVNNTSYNHYIGDSS